MPAAFTASETFDEKKLLTNDCCTKRLIAIYAVYTSVSGYLTAWLLSEPFSAINTRLMGYNAVLWLITHTGKNN
ncbi:urea transporter [Agriterribacter sp.]|uniref:urea transporter n=1 Tax=Agriterribacter sp. TaxID=2821509 RepID=UPI0039C8A318